MRSSLPAELLYIIFSYVPLKTLLTLRKVYHVAHRVPALGHRLSQAKKRSFSCFLPCIRRDTEWQWVCEFYKVLHAEVRQFGSLLAGLAIRLSSHDFIERVFAVHGGVLALQSLGLGENQFLVLQRLRFYVGIAVLRGAIGFVEFLFRHYPTLHDGFDQYLMCRVNLVKDAVRSGSKEMLRYIVDDCFPDFAFRHVLVDDYRMVRDALVAHHVDVLRFLFDRFHKEMHSDLHVRIPTKRGVMTAARLWLKHRKRGVQ